MKLIPFAILAAALAFGAESPRTFTGIITDTMCAADHSHMGVAPNDKCVRECVKSGNGQYKYALLDANKKVYVLSDQQTPEKFAARKVKIMGTLYEKTGILKVDRIELAQ